MPRRSSAARADNGLAHRHVHARQQFLAKFLAPQGPAAPHLFSIVIGAIGSPWLSPTLQLSRVEKRVRENHNVPFTFDAAVPDLIPQRCTELGHARSHGRCAHGKHVVAEIGRELLSRLASGQEIKRVSGGDEGREFCLSIQLIHERPRRGGLKVASGRMYVASCARRFFRFKSD